MDRSAAVVQRRHRHGGDFLGRICRSPGRRRRPPSLKAIVTCCSTDDRYRDDVHYMGGCLLNDGISWGSGLFSCLSAGRILSSSAMHGGRCGGNASKPRDAR